MKNLLTGHDSRVNTSQVKMNNLEAGQNELSNLKRGRFKGKKWDNIRYPNTSIIGIPGERKIFGEIMIEI